MSLCFFFAAKSQSQEINKRTIKINDHWKFREGNAENASDFILNDKDWRKVDLPHDWSIEDFSPSRYKTLTGQTVEADEAKTKLSAMYSGPFYNLAPGQNNTAYTVGGTAWYRKEIKIPLSYKKNKKVYLTFEGVYMNADCWINGHFLGNHPYGYTEFEYDITPYLNNKSEQNVIAVKVNNTNLGSRWYAGSGIYRNVLLTVTNKVHFDNYGIKVSTIDANPDRATIEIGANVINEGKIKNTLQVKHELINKDGKVVASSITNATPDVKNTIQLKINNPALWDVTSPNMYVLKSTLFDKQKIWDVINTNTGIRKTEFIPNEGFFLNGKNIKLKGGCMHHDNGALGARAFDDAEYRRVRIMKQNGFNAIRTSHNPPSRAFLDACDRLGIMVIDEMFDEWIEGKTEEDYHKYFYDWWKKDVAMTVKRDWNHPSVILWSTGNEIKGKNKAPMIKASAEMTAFLRNLDGSREVTSGVNLWEGDNENWDSIRTYFMDPYKIVGYNYLPGKYKGDHEKYPQRLLYSAESFQNYITDYSYPVMDNKYMIGDFVWTAYDYIGEVSIGWNYSKYPWTLAYCGDIDICGFKRPSSYYRETLWGSKHISLFVHNPQPSFDLKSPDEKRSDWSYDDVYDHWNWAKYSDSTLRVDVYSTGDHVKLFVNDRLVGEADVSRKTDYKAKFKVPFEAGEIKAVAYKNGTVVESFKRVTAGAVNKIKLLAEQPAIKADRNKLAFVEVNLVDNKGTLNPVDDQLVTYEITGPGEIVAVGSGNPTSTESFQAGKRKTFLGKGLVVIRSTGKPGEIILSAKSGNVISNKLNISAK